MLTETDRYWIEKGKRKEPWVTNLAQAYDAYWNAHSFRQEQAAYHEILLFGGKDGYRLNGWRSWAARSLRRLACWIDP